jgi:hypothetical protein
MVVASLTLACLVRDSGSLKDKRQVIRSLKERIRSRFNVSVAEVEYQELWQRATIGVAVVAADGQSARHVLEQITRFVEQDVRLSLLDAALDFR